MPKITVTLIGRGSITLTDNDYVCAGGEGKIYRKADTIVKIFTSPEAALGIRDKMKHFVGLKFPYIAAPEGLVLDGKNQPLGCYMPFVSGEALSLLFTSEFRSRVMFSDKDASILVLRMQETVSFAHSKKAILVDPNELNWIAVLKPKAEPEPRIIDVDSWVVDGRIPATVPKMPSIRDWHSKSVSTESDWYAWGIVSFLLYTGVHPFRGVLAGYKPAETERRMKDNKSVFTPGVKLNAAVRDFSCIPAKLLEWYRVTFSTSQRSIPPSPFEVSGKTAPAIQVLRTTVTATGKLKFERILEKIGESVTRIFPCGVVLTREKNLYDLPGGRFICKVQSNDCQVIRAEGGWIVTDNGEFWFISDNFDPEIMEFHIPGKVIAAAGRLFSANERGLTELTYRHLGRPILSTGKTWGMLFNSTKFFDEVGVQDALGAMFLIVPFGTNAVGQIRVKELDRLKVLNAKAGNRFVSVMAMNSSGEYVKTEFTFSEDYSSYSVWTGMADSPDMNISILPKGVSATIVEDGELVIFVPRSGAINKIADKDIKTNLILSRWENAVLYIKNGAVWRISVA